MAMGYSSVSLGIRLTHLEWAVVLSWVSECQNCIV